MLRPSGLQIDALVDASVQAYSRATVERRFEGSQLPRLSEAGILEPAEVMIAIRFSVIDEHVALEGSLNGFVTMTCQRCMQPVKLDVSDTFRLVIVDEELDAETEVSGYDPVVADPAHLDTRWIAEEQALLSLPLVPKHADVNCAGEELPSGASAAKKSTQRPFADLKKLLRDQ